MFFLEILATLLGNKVPGKLLRFLRLAARGRCGRQVPARRPLRAGGGAVPPASVCVSGCRIGRLQAVLEDGFALAAARGARRGARRGAGGRSPNTGEKRGWGLTRAWVHWSSGDKAQAFSPRSRLFCVLFHHAYPQPLSQNSSS